MDAATRDFVRRRARNRCEYCLLPQEHSELAHHVEHIVAKQHGGGDDSDNLALACQRCNLCNGSNLTGRDPVSGDVAALFHPRRDRWAEHFAFRGARIDGVTPVGRATARLLAVNDTRRMELRSELIAAGQF